VEVVVAVGEDLGVAFVVVLQTRGAAVLSGFTVQGF
jgi:hypothetical protein